MKYGRVKNPYPTIFVSSLCIMFGKTLLLLPILQINIKEVLQSPHKKWNFDSYTYCSCWALIQVHLPVQEIQLSRWSLVFTSFRVPSATIVTVGSRLGLFAALQLAPHCTCWICVVPFEWSHRLLGPVTCLKRLWAECWGPNFHSFNLDNPGRSGNECLSKEATRPSFQKKEPKMGEGEQTEKWYFPLRVKLCSTWEEISPMWRLFPS